MLLRVGNFGESQRCQSQDVVKIRMIEKSTGNELAEHSRSPSERPE